MYRCSPGGSAGKEPVCNARTAGTVSSVLGWGGSQGGRAWQPTPVLSGEAPRTEEPGRLQSIGSPRVGHECSDLARRRAFMCLSIICPDIPPSIHTSILYIIYVSMYLLSRYLCTVYLLINHIYLYIHIYTCICQASIHSSTHIPIYLSDLSYHWQSQLLGRLIRSLGVTKERGVWNSQGGGKDKLFFFILHSLGLCNNNVSCLRTASGEKKSIFCLILLS